MDRELCFFSDNGCLCNNSISQAHLRKCFLSADWSQQRWGESTRSSQNVVRLLNLCSGQKCLTFSNWCRTISTTVRSSSGAQKGTTEKKIILIWCFIWVSYSNVTSTCAAVNITHSLIYSYYIHLHLQHVGTLYFAQEHLSSRLNRPD